MLFLTQPLWRWDYSHVILHLAWKLISCSPRVWKSEIQRQPGQVLVRALCWVSDCYLLLWQKDHKKVLWGPFYKGTNPIHEGSTLIMSKRSHLLIPTHYGLGFQHTNLRGLDTSIQFHHTLRITAVRLISSKMYYLTPSLRVLKCSHDGSSYPSKVSVSHPIYSKSFS
jgi:hypothetical protein